MKSSFEKDSYQELIAAVRRATPSVDEQLLSSETVATRAEQIAQELSGDLQCTVHPEDEAVFRGQDAFTELSSEAAIGARQETLLSLRQRVQVTVNNEKIVTDKIQENTAQLSSDLQALMQTFHQFRELQRVRQEQEFHTSQVIDETVNVLQEQFASYEAALRQTGRTHPQKNDQRPVASDISKEAQFLAEAQVRRDLLNQQRQNQLKQGRVVFFVALALLSFGVLLVFAGILSIYVFNLATGTITAVSGTTINLISAVVLQFHRQENERLDALTRELSVLDRVTMAMHYISYISDAEKKDQAIVDLTKQLYTVTDEPKK